MIRHLAPEIVAIVEHHGASLLQGQHGLDVNDHRVQHPGFVP